MENKKFIVCTFILILSGILSNNTEIYSCQNKSKTCLQKADKYDGTSTIHIGNLLQSESEEGNQAVLVEFSISNSIGLVANLTGVGLASYPGENLTIKFEIYDISLNRTIDFDENDTASFLINFTKSNGVIDNGTLLNSINFNNRTKEFSGIIGTSFLNEGTHNITINIILMNYTILPYVFTLTIKPLTYMVNFLFSDPGGIIPQRNFFIGSNITVEFQLREMDVNISYILDKNNQANYQIKYYKITGMSEKGTLSNQINFDNQTENFFGTIETSALPEGYYLITIIIDTLNNTIIPRSLYFKVNKKYEVIVSISRSNEIMVGEKITVSIFIQYKEQLDPFEGASIILTVRINSGNIIGLLNKKTNSQGYVSVVYTIPLRTNNMSLEVEVASEYNSESAQLKISNIRVTTLSEVVFTLIFYIGFIISSIFISVLLYIKFVSPNKREKARMINEYRQIFKDISHLEWIFIIIQKNRKCIFYKTYISKKKNQERIDKYISFLSGFKNTTKSQNSLSENSYEGKILLEANGNHITAGLVLSNNCSKILKNNFREFISNFENLYGNLLVNGEENLIPYKEIERLLEDKLNIFITQPHEIENNFLDNISSLKSEAKTLSFINRFKINKNSRRLLHKTVTLIKTTGKNFFYISTLLGAFSKHKNKGIIKFFLSINELRHNGIIITIYNKS